MKLAQAMVHMMNRAGEKAKIYREKVNLKIEESTRSGTIVTRRQMLWMLLESPKPFDHSDIAYGFDHLGRLSVVKHDLHEFLIAWNHSLDNMGRHVTPDENLRDVFFCKIKDEPALQYDVNQYERTFEGNPRK